MLYNISRDKRYVRKYDPRTGRIHIWRRGTPVPTAGPPRHPKAADLDEIFGKEKTNAPGPRLELAH